jgi:hypothetical protein
MLLVIFCGIAALFAALAAFSAYNKRKFYRDHAQKMSAKVTSHRQVSLMGDRAYELIVLAENCFTYKITTTCRAAKKLVAGKSVDILVPDRAEPDTGDIIMEDLQNKEAMGILRPDEAETLMLLRELAEVTSRMGSAAVPKEKRVILCKECVSSFDFWRNVAIASVFMMFNVVILITMIVENRFEF